MFPGYSHIQLLSKLVKLIKQKWKFKAQVIIESHTKITDSRLKLGFAMAAPNNHIVTCSEQRQQGRRATPNLGWHNKHAENNYMTQQHRSKSHQIFPDSYQNFSQPQK